MYVLIGNLPFNLGEDHIRALWRRYVGAQPELSIIKRTDNMRLWTGAAIAKTSWSLALRAQERLNGQPFRGRNLLVYASPDPQGEPFAPARGLPRSAGSSSRPPWRTKACLKLLLETPLGVSGFSTIEPADYQPVHDERSRWAGSKYDGTGFDPDLCSVCQTKRPIFRGTCQHCMERPQTKKKEELLFPWELDTTIDRCFKAKCASMETMNLVLMSARWYLWEKETAEADVLGEGPIARRTIKRAHKRRRVRHA